MKVRVREYRKDLGLTQEQLAHKAGLTRNTIHNVERGKTVPSVRIALMIAEALDVEVDLLFSLQEEAESVTGKGRREPKQATLGPYTAIQVADVLNLFDDGSWDLEWNMDDQGNLEMFWINCNDLFMWGSADGERIEPDDIAGLRSAKEDAERHSCWPELWVARKRQMRPQGAVLNKMKAPRKVVELFLSAGPERAAEFCNPEAWKGFGDDRGQKVE